MARVLPDFDREQPKETEPGRLTANVPFSLSGIGNRVQNGVEFFFFLYSAILWLPLPPIGLSDPCSHRRKNKTQVALSGHHRDHGTWSTRCCRYLPPIGDTYLSLDPREKSLLLLGTTATILPRSCLVRRVRSKLVTDIIDILHTVRCSTRTTMLIAPIENPCHC